MKHQDIVPRLLAWFTQNARSLPWRRTRDPYAIWVSEIMLQQTQVKTVLPFWERWMRALPNLAVLANAKPQTLHKLWEGLGYYARVGNLQRAAQLIMAQHHGRFPHDFEDVLALPGVGRYTAGAICSIAFNQPRPILDGNVIRVLTRCYGIAGTPRARRVNARLWQLAQELVQRAAEVGVRTTTVPYALHIAQHASRSCAQFNESLMELGALVCTPQQPRCGVCPIAKYCAAYQQGRIHELPTLSRRIRATPRRFVAFVAKKRGRFLVRQRPAGVVNAHLWEFPNLELAPDDSDLNRAARSVLGVRPEALELLATIKHSITRYRITLEAYCVASRQTARIPSAKGHWLGRSRLNQLAFTSAHKQVLQRLGGR
ncbi:MAG: A/G-specific adenine glycosylase [Limisphaerales bacterium]